MAKQISRFSISLGIGAAILIGCSNPDPNPIQPVPNTREGTELDPAWDHIPLDGSPYLWDHTTTDVDDREVLVDWVIEEGRTVTIDPGVEIMFAGKYAVKVEGQLIARGEPDAPITFTTAFNDRKFGQWRGLRFTNPDTPSEIEHCIFSYGAFFDTDTLTETGQEAQNYRGMLAIWNSSPVIERCVIYFNQNNGVYVKGEQSVPTVRYCIISDNDASGIRADSISMDLIGNPGNPRIAYNCVADNSAPPFIVGQDTLPLFGRYVTTNNNVDSCDIFFNIDLPALMLDPANDDFGLQSCSPCIDAGPFNPIEDEDPDGTIADMGIRHYIRSAAEIRGRTEGTLDATTYDMTCDVVVAPEATLTIPAGARIEASGVYAIEVHGTLIIEGTDGNRVWIGPHENNGNDLWGGLVFFDREGPAPSAIRNADIISFDHVDVEKPGVVFENVLFESGFSYGVRVNTRTFDENGRTVFSRCEFINSGTFAIESDSSAIDIHNVLIDGAKGRGISLFYTYESSVIRNTIIRACSTTAIYIADFSNPELTNNTFADCGYYGIHMVNNCFPTIVNTIVYNSRRTGVFDAESSCPILDYNDVYHLPDDEGVDYVSGDNCSLFLTTSIDSDPLFVGAEDYHLRSGSPCINAGDPDIQDSDGSRSDMGAYGGPEGGMVGLSAVSSGSAAVASR